MNDTNRVVYEQLNENFRQAWDFYLKFYNVFLTANVLGLGLVAEHINGNARYPIAIAFIIQNMLTGITSFYMMYFTRETNRNVISLIGTKDSDISPVPVKLGKWGGVANTVSCISLIGCWIGTLWLNIK